MDDPSLEPALHTGALRGLERINAVSVTARALWRPLRRLAGTRPLRVLDIACGAGDVAIGLRQRARREGLPIEVAACDMSARAVAHARGRAEERGADVEFFTCDVLKDEFPSGYDAHLCTLFLHHLRESEAVELLRRMATGRALLVSDLVRGRPGSYPRLVCAAFCRAARELSFRRRPRGILTVARPPLRLSLRLLVLLA